jgi:hypothetical protein
MAPPAARTSSLAQALCAVAVGLVRAQQPHVQPPDPPAGLRCTAAGTTQLRLGWQAPAARPGVPPPDIYHIRGALATAQLPHIAQTVQGVYPPASEALVVDLLPGTRYSFAVRGHAGVQGPGADFEWGNFSRVEECSTLPLDLAAPHSLARSGRLNSTTIEVQWVPGHTSSDSAAGDSELRWKTEQNGTQVHSRAVPTAPGPYTIEGLQPGTIYLVQVEQAGKATDWVPFRTAAAGRRYATMYRITENGAKSGGTVDFLSSHNSADANGSFATTPTDGDPSSLHFDPLPMLSSATGSAAFLTFAFAGGDDHTLNTLNLSTVTQYCVEMVDEPWADYVSCAMGTAQ